MLTSNPNECNSTLSSVTGGTYPHPDTYIYKCSLVVWNLGSPCNLRSEDTHICKVSSTSFPGLYQNNTGSVKRFLDLIGGQFFKPKSSGFKLGLSDLIQALHRKRCTVEKLFCPVQCLVHL